LHALQQHHQQHKCLTGATAAVSAEFVDAACRLFAEVPTLQYLTVLHAVAQIGNPILITGMCATGLLTWCVQHIANAASACRTAPTAAMVLQALNIVGTVARMPDLGPCVASFFGTTDVWAALRAAALEIRSPDMWAAAAEAAIAVMGNPATPPSAFFANANAIDTVKQLVTGNNLGHSTPMLHALLETVMQTALDVVHVLDRKAVYDVLQHTGVATAVASTPALARAVAAWMQAVQ
jgi:hypothetical protein